MQTEPTAYLLRELAELRRENERLQRRASDARRSRDKWREKARTQRRTLPAGDPRHGTDNGYNNLGCRCQRCRRAHTEAHTAWTHRVGRNKPRAVYVAERRAEAEARDNHGTESRYVNLGCRCDECRAGAAEARRRRRHEGAVLTHNANGYRNGCRCEVCTSAHNERLRSYRHAARRGEDAQTSGRAEAS